MILTALIGLVALFVLDVGVGIRRGFGFRHYWFFEVLHFLGGFFVAMLMASFLSFWQTMAGLALITVLWEGLELLLAEPKLGRRLREILRLPLKEYSWWDTSFDIVLNYLGAFLFFRFF